MPGSDAKQLVYRYDGDENGEEIVQDLNGAITTPQKDQVILRNGKLWRVVFVTTEFSISRTGPIPVVRVFLVDAKKQ